MAFTIPNAAEAFHSHQAQVDSGDMRILTDALGGTGVISGCAVSAQGSPNMTVAVGSGEVRIGSTRALVASGNVTITAANGTNPRFDLITVNASGTKAAIAGAPASAPVFPTIPASTVVLAAVYVPAGVTAILSTYIVDKRFVLEGGASDAVRFVAASNADTKEKATADYLCTGTNDHLVIQAALNDLLSTGGLVQLSSGQFNVAGTITITKDNTQLVGRGTGSRASPQLGLGTTIRVASGFSGTHVINVDNGGGVSPVYAVMLKDFFIHGGLVGTGINGVQFKSNRGLMDTVHVQNVTGHGVIVEGVSGWNTYDTEFRGVMVGRNVGDGFRLNTSAIDLHFIHCVSFNNSGHGMYFNRASGSSSSQQITGCHFYDNGENQITFYGTGSRTKIVNCKIEGTNSSDLPPAGKHGIYFDTTLGGYSDIIIVGNGFKDNGNAADNTYDHISIQSGSTGVNALIVGNIFSYTSGPKVRYGVNLSNTGAQGWVVEANRFGQVSNYGTAMVNNAGNQSGDLRCLVRHNQGHVTEMSGTDSISAATSKVVTHGLSVTPALKDILVTPTSDPGSGIRWWVSAVTSTTFTLTTSASATFNFAWQAHVLYR